MQAIIDFFKGIADFFATVIDFVITIVSDLISMIQTIGKVVLQIPNYLGFLPAGLVGILVAGIGVVVLYKVLGRSD